MSCILHQFNFPVILRFQGHEDRSDELLATDRTAPMPPPIHRRIGTIPTPPGRPGARGRAWSGKSSKPTLWSAPVEPACASSPLIQIRPSSTASCVIGKTRAAGQGIPSGRVLRPAPLPARFSKPRVSHPACRPGGRPVELCPTSWVNGRAKRSTRGRQLIAGLPASGILISTRPCAACPLVFPHLPYRYLPCPPIFPSFP